MEVVAADEHEAPFAEERLGHRERVRSPRRHPLVYIADTPALIRHAEMIPDEAAFIANDEDNLVYLPRERIDNVFEDGAARHLDKRLRTFQGERPHAFPFSGCENNCLHEYIFYNT